MAEPKKSAIVTIRAKKSFYMPPAESGFANLITPVAFGDNPAKYELDAHYRPAAFDLIKAQIQAKCYDAQLEELHEEILKNGGRKKDPLPVDEWLEAQLRQPKEKSRVQLPFIKIRREGQTARGPIMMGCWGPDGTPLELPKLKMGQGSVIQPAVFFNLWASKAGNWVPQPSLKLVGIKVLQLKSFGGAGGPVAPDADDEAIAKVMGSNFDMDTDLSKFAVGHDDAPAHDDLDDDSPF